MASPTWPPPKQVARPIPEMIVRSIGDLWKRAVGREHSGAATQQLPLAT